MTDRLDRAIAHDRGEVELMQIEQAVFDGRSQFCNEGKEVVVVWNGSTVVTIREEGGKEVRLFVEELKEVLIRIKAERRRIKNQELYEWSLRINWKIDVGAAVVGIILGLFFVLLVRLMGG